MNTTLRYIFQIFTVFCAFSFIICALPSASVAQQDDRGLIISPKRIVFEEGERVEEIILANRGSAQATYRIAIVNKAMTEDGQMIEAATPAENEFFADDILRYSPRQITLGPKETQKIRIMSRLKSTSPDGEYRSHVLIQEIPKPEDLGNAIDEPSSGLGINIHAIFGISLPVIIRKGELSAQIALSDPKIHKDGGHDYLDLYINRKGTKSVLGTLNAFADSEKIATLKNVGVYLSTPRRLVSLKLDPDIAKRLSGKNIRITYAAEEENEDTPPAEITFAAP